MGVVKMVLVVVVGCVIGSATCEDKASNEANNTCWICDSMITDVF